MLKLLPIVLITKIKDVARRYDYASLKLLKEDGT